MTIKEIRIFSRKETIEKDLKKLWEGRADYLVEVLSKVEVYAVDPWEYTKTKLNLL